METKENRAERAVRIRIIHEEYIAIDASREKRKRREEKINVNETRASASATASMFT